MVTMVNFMLFIFYHNKEEKNRKKKKKEREYVHPFLWEKNAPSSRVLKSLPNDPICLEISWVCLSLERNLES